MQDGRCVRFRGFNVPRRLVSVVNSGAGAALCLSFEFLSTNAFIRMILCGTSVPYLIR